MVFPGTKQELQQDKSLKFFTFLKFLMNFVFYHSKYLKYVENM